MKGDWEKIFSQSPGLVRVSERKLTDLGGKFPLCNEAKSFDKI